MIDSGTLAFGSTFSQDVAFTGASGVLKLARSQGYAGAVSGFSKTGGTSFDLLDVGFTGAGEASFSGNHTSGVLTVTDGTHTAHITLTGDYTGVTFVASNDGHGGVSIIDTPPPPRRSTPWSPPWPPCRPPERRQRRSPTTPTPSPGARCSRPEGTRAFA